MSGFAEEIKLYDKDNALVDTMTLPANYMEGEMERSVTWCGRKFVEGGGRDNFYGKGQFAEVQD